MIWRLLLCLLSVSPAAAQFKGVSAKIGSFEAPLAPAAEPESAGRQIPADISLEGAELPAMDIERQPPLVLEPAALPAAQASRAAVEKPQDHDQATQADHPTGLDPEELLSSLGEPSQPAMASAVAALKTALRHNKDLRISIEDGLEPGIQARTEVSIADGRRTALISLSPETWRGFRRGDPKAVDRINEELTHAAQRVLDGQAMTRDEYSARRAFFEVTAQAARKTREEKIAMGRTLRHIKGLIDAGDYEGALRAAGLSRRQEARFQADYALLGKTQVNYSSVAEDPLGRAHELAALAALDSDNEALATELDEAGRVLDAAAAEVDDLIHRSLVAKASHGQLMQLTARIKKLLTLNNPAVKQKPPWNLITDKRLVASRLEFLRKLARLSEPMAHMGQTEAENWSRAAVQLIERAPQPMAADIVDVALGGRDGKKAADIRRYVELRLAYEFEPDLRLKGLATDLAEALYPGVPSSYERAFAKGLLAGRALDLIHGYVALGLSEEKGERAGMVSGFVIHLSILGHAPVDGAERLFDEAYEELQKVRNGRDATVEGYFDEAELSVRVLMLPGWTLKKASLRHLPDSAGVERPIRVRGVDRQIDAVAEFNSETLFIEYKRTLDALLRKKNGQIEALIELARQRGAVPGIMVAGLERRVDGTMRIKSGQRVDVMRKILEWERAFPGVPQPRIFDRAGNDLTQYFMLDGSWEIKEVGTEVDLIAVHAGKAFYIHFPGFFDDPKDLKQRGEQLMDFAKERGIVPALLLEGAALVGGRLELRYGRQDVHALIKHLGEAKRHSWGYPRLRILDVYGNDITDYF